MLEVRSASDTKVVIFGTITLHLRTGRPRTCVTVGVAETSDVPVLSGKTFIDCLIKSVQPADGIMVPHRSPLLLTSIVHEAWCVAEKKRVGFPPFNYRRLSTIDNAHWKRTKVYYDFPPSRLKSHVWNSSISLKASGWSGIRNCP